MLGDQANVLDPMRRDYRGREHDPGVAREIVEGDEADIRASDVCLFRWDGRGSAGTTMELYFASRVAKKPCILWDDRPPNISAPLSPWVMRHVHGIASDLAAAADQALRHALLSHISELSTEIGALASSVQATVERTFRFEAAHRLPRVPAGHKCGRLHGHSYAVTLVVEGEVDPWTGWVCDFADLTAAWAPIGAMLDHRTLNDIDGLENPTSENLARWVWERTAQQLPGFVEVRVSETCASCVTFRGCGHS